VKFRISNSRLDDYKRCARFFYFHGIAGWVLDTPQYALAFGGAWHKAMDVVWKQINQSDVADNAYLAFLKEWQEEFNLPHPDEMGPAEIEKIGMRHPFTAYEMIINYIATRRAWILECELLDVESYFKIPLSDDVIYSGLIDKVVKRRGRIHGIEHKTTSAYKKDGPFKKSFIESFTPDSQIDGYLYAGRELYGEAFQGIYVDGALVHKTIHDGFCMIPVQRHLDQLKAWKWETLEWTRRLRQDMKSTEDGEGIMEAWPKNTRSCWDFNTTCPYLTPCKSWPDPRGKELPPGYVEEKWDPFVHLDLEKLKP